MAQYQQTTTAPPMATFVARCLEEIALEGRCGIPLRTLFDLVDPTDDVAYRQYAWRVLRTMRDHLRFHHMERSPVACALLNGPGARPQQSTVTTATTASTRPQQLSTQAETPSSPMSSPPRRKRKWSTTLMSSPRESDNEQQQSQEQSQQQSQQQQQQQPRHSEISSSMSDERGKVKPSRLEPVVPSARRKALKKQRKLLASADKTRRQDNSSSLSSRQSPQIKKERHGNVDTSRSSALRTRPQRDDVATSTSAPQLVESASTVTARRVDDCADEQKAETDDSRVTTTTSEAFESVQPSLPPPTAAFSTVATSPESMDWIFQSPRGFVLGVQVDASSLSYEDATLDAAEGILGVVACEELRLQYLGVTDPSAIDPLSPQFDLLELIGRARAHGENAALLASSLVFGDARKLHYLLDMLLAGSLIAKRMVAADHKRFNILHLARFTRAFHPSMVSPTATLLCEVFPKKLVPYVIAEMLVARGERTCVFADIGRELGYDKRHQEKLRKMFFHEMHVNRAFPLELFMARCNTGGASEYSGRKLWCLRLRHGPARGGHDSLSDRFEALEPPPPATTGPVLERGIMEQVYAVIESRGAVGATIPEIRDILGVPTFKLPYRLAQGLIAKYNLTVRQVVVGKSTMYRMFVPGSDATAPQDGDQQQQQQQQPQVAAADQPSDGASTTVDDAAGRTQSSEPVMCAAGTTTKVSTPLPSTMKAAARGVLMSSTAERRRQYMLERIEQEKIVPVHQLRSELMVLERDPALAGKDLNIIDSRSIRRIVDDFEAAQLVVSMDITLPPRRVLQKSDRVVKCVCLAGYERDRDAIRTFVNAYVDEQQRRFLRDLTAPVAADVVVETKRSRGRRKAAETATATLNATTVHATEVVQYNAASYKTTRMIMTKQQKQARRLGMYFGALYRCRALHVLLWDKIALLREKAASLTSTPSSSTTSEPRPCAGATAVAASAISSKVGKPAAETRRKPRGDTVFALHDVLELLSVKEYIQLAGTNELLNETEENKVRMATVRGDSWDALSSDVRAKIRGCESERFSRLVRTLIALGLVYVANDSSHGLLSIFRSRDFDAMVSQVASATLSGGLLKLKHRAQIVVTRGDEVLAQLPTQQSYVYAAGFSGKSRSEHLVGRVPLTFDFASADDAQEYWKALQFLSIEGAYLGSGAGDGETLSGTVSGSERIRSAPLKEHNLYTLKSWVPRSMTNHGRSSAKQKAEEAVAEPMRILKRKRFQNTVDKSRDTQMKKKLKATDAAIVVAPKRSTTDSGAFAMPSAAHTEAGVSQFRRLVQNKQSVRASKWTLADDMKLMDAYVAELSCKWFIEVPLALQRSDEPLAFRNAALERTKISWRTLAKTVGKKFRDCYLRVHELLAAPAVRARVENTKMSITALTNPGGQFHEERAIAAQPRLAALVTRALQILLHERASYYPLLADMLISQWTEREVKLVWRYLWLAGLITRTTRKSSESASASASASAKHHRRQQQERGFCVHSRVYEMKYLGIAHYPLDVFCAAAEYAAFVHENAKEAAMLESDDGSDDAAESECVLEHDVEPNASAGHIAAALSAMVLAVSEMVPEYVEPSAARAAEAAAPLNDSKRAIAIKGVAGHLAAVCGGVAPDDFLRDFWTVKSRVPILLDEAKQDAVATRAKAMEAFSMSPALRDADSVSSSDPSGGEDTGDSAHVSASVLQALRAPGPDGLSFRELCGVLTANDKPRERAESTVRRALDQLVSRGDVVQVSAFSHARFVLKELSGIWTLHPYRIVDDAATPGKVFIRFDKQQTIVAQPWQLLDGSANTRAELVLKRKVVNIIMCNPGIRDHALQRQMRKVLTLQTLRTLVDELVADDIVHVRLVRGTARQPRSVFALCRRPRVHVHALAALAPGDACFVDSTRDEIHYFPAVNCMELLGAAACDADMRDD